MYLEIPVQELFLDLDATLRDALDVLQNGQCQIALVVDADGVLKGLATDGDVRRAILSGKRLDSPVRDVMATDFVKADKASTRDEVTRLMKKHKIQHVPIVDAGRVVDLAWITKLMLAEEELDMQAVIMAGGFGKRLRPLTNSVPKPLLPLHNKPVCHHILDCLVESGIRQVTFTTHYKHEQFVEYFEKLQYSGCSLEFIVEETPLGTAGGLSLLSNKQRDTLVVNGDILTQIDYRAMHRFHKEQDAYLTMAASNHVYNVEYGVVNCRGSEVTEIEEKPSYNFLINAGIYILSPEAIADIPKDRRFDMTEIIQEGLGTRRKVACFPILEYWKDIGILNDYHQAHSDMQDSQRNSS